MIILVSSLLAMEREDGEDVDVYEAVDRRRAVRAFSDESVPREVLHRVLVAAARAPSSGNLQPWHLYVVTGEPLAELKKRATARAMAGDPGDSPRLSLRRLRQPHLGVWATHKPTLRSRSIPFLRWSTARRLCPPGLSIEHQASQLPGHFQAEDEARNALLRCFNDTALPLDVRVAAALVRLYALPLTRIVELTEDHISRDQEHTYLVVNQHPFVLPPKLARLIDDQLRHSTLRHGATAGRRYLLPGQSPGRPRNPLGLADTLRHHGLPADLPPMVLADLLGIHPRTPERWATLAGGNWSEYVSSLT